MSRTTSPGAIVSAVAGALDSAWSQSESIGADLVTQCVTVMRKYFGDGGIEEDTRELILNKLAIMRGWSDKSAKSRKSEARALLTEYVNLEALVTAWRKASATCTWHDVVKLAREIGKWEGARSLRVKATVSALLERSENAAKPDNKLSKEEAYKKGSVKIKSLLAMTKGLPKSFRDALLIAATDANFKL